MIVVDDKNQVDVTKFIKEHPMVEKFWATAPSWYMQTTEGRVITINIKLKSGEIKKITEHGVSELMSKTEEYLKSING